MVQRLVRRLAFAVLLITATSSGGLTAGSGGTGRALAGVPSGTTLLQAASMTLSGTITVSETATPPIVLTVTAGGAVFTGLSLDLPCSGAVQIVDDTASGSTTDLSAAVLDIVALSATFGASTITYTAGSTPPPTLVAGTYTDVQITLTDASATSMTGKPITTAHAC